MAPKKARKRTRSPVKRKSGGTRARETPADYIRQQLLELAAQQGIDNCSKLNKQELFTALSLGKRRPAYARRRQWWRPVSFP